MEGNDNSSPGLPKLVGRLVRTGLGALQNRFELFSVEWQEEKARLMEMLILTVATLFFALSGMLLLTATIILLFPPRYRLYAAAGFALLYGLGAVIAWNRLAAALKREPFSETVDQVKKDRVWLDSLK